MVVFSSKYSKVEEEKFQNDLEKEEEKKTYLKKNPIIVQNLKIFRNIFF